MLEELSKYESLGTPGSYWKLLTAFRDAPTERWFVKSVAGLFRNTIIDDRSIFDGCLPLLAGIGILEINELEEIIVDEQFLKYLGSEAQLVDLLVERMLLALNSDSAFHNIFCSKYISYDIVFKAIQIDNSAFPLKYSSFKQLLIDFSVLLVHPSATFKKYIINVRYKKIFDKVVLPEIKKRKVGLEELQRTLEMNRIYGEEAERFVMCYETNRLGGVKEINWVAEYSVSDGYDIASYETKDSSNFDRFIEVKSFDTVPCFFWSRNEIEVARIRKDNYYLYLVDRSRMSSCGYSPIIIKNPYDSVLKNPTEWEQRVEKIRLQKV